MPRLVHLLFLGAAWTALPAAPTTPSETLGPSARRGRAFDVQACASCHGRDGAGVPSLQPALTNNAFVRGDAAQLIRVVLQGPAKVLPADRPKYANLMPAFPTMPDDRLADVLTYLRTGFGNDAPAVSTNDVAAVRRASKP